MSNWNFDPRIKERSEDPAVRELQQIMMEFARKLRVGMREIDVDNLAPDFLPTIQNSEKAELQIVKGKAPNAYFGADGELFKIIDPVGSALSQMPVGYVYISTSPISPQTLFGGTWKRIEGRFLLAASDAYPAGSIGGEATHALTEAELPALSGSFRSRGWNGAFSLLSSPSGIVSQTDESGSAYGTPNDSTSVGYRTTTISFGEDQPHNNMPPYFALYMWERTA